MTQAGAKVRAGAAALALTACVAALACRPRGEAIGRGIVRSFPEAEELFEVGRIADSVPVPPSAPSGSEVAGWKVIEGSVERRAGSPELRLTSFPVVLARSAPLRSETADEITLDLEGFRFPAFVKLSWSASGAPAGSDSSLVGRASRTDGAKSRPLRLDLWRSPAWSGEIGALELRISSTPGVPVVLRDLAWSKSRISPERVRAVEGRRLLVELGHERRSALLLRCGSSRTLELPARGPGWIDLGVAELSGRASRKRLRVRVGQRELVLQPSASAALEDVGWADGRVPASTAAHQQVELAVECESPAPDGSEFLFVSKPAFLPEPSAPPRRIVLVSIDTLRADRMSLYGYGRPTTPRLDAWSARYGVVFDRALAPSTSTLPSHASMFTGLPARSHGAYLFRPVASELTLLAEELRDAGFLTFAATGGGFVHPGYGFAQGFDRFRFWPRGEEGAQEELPDSIARVRSWLDRYRDWPLFLFLHTYEVHGPYSPRPGYLKGLVSWAGADDVRVWPRDRFNPDVDERASQVGGEALAFERLKEREPILQEGGRRRPLGRDEFGAVSDFYDTGVARADDLLGPLLNELLASSDSETTVIVTSDHGEALGDHGLWGHGFLYEHNLRVPLVIAGSGVDAIGARRPEVAGLDALRATVLDLAGLPTPAGVPASLLELLGGTPRAPAEPVESYAPETSQGIALVSGWRKVIVRDSAVISRELDEEAFDLALDPGELRPLPAVGDELSSLRREALRRLAAPDNAGVFVSIENHASNPWSGSLCGDDLRWQTVKWAGRPAPGLLRFEAPGCLAVTLDPRAAVSLRVGVSGAAVSWHLVDSASRLGIEATLEELCSLQKTFENRSRVKLHLERRGLCAAGEVDPTAQDADLHDRLRALGYLQ